MNGQGTAVVFGGRGTLGSALVPGLERAGWRVAAAPTRGECDITDVGAVNALLARTRPDVVFNAAGYTDVERAEDEHERAWAVNATAVQGVAVAAAGAGAAVLHYSTDFVFDGASPMPYVETDAPAPISAYARSKVEGDRLVAAANPRHFILRVGCLYGRGGRNFPSSIVRRLRAGETIRADRDRVVAPSWVREVAAVSAAIASTAHHGLYHCMAHGEATWADFARLAAELVGVPSDRVQVVGFADLPLKARRPTRAVLDNRALRAIGMDTMSAWPDALRAFVAEEIAAST
jgi:dTDP-4-dehydrorhamnose reductase